MPIKIRSSLPIPFLNAALSLRFSAVPLATARFLRRTARNVVLDVALSSSSSFFFFFFFLVDSRNVTVSFFSSSSSSSSSSFSLDAFRRSLSLCFSAALRARDLSPFSSLLFQNRFFSSTTLSWSSRHHHHSFIIIIVHVVACVARVPPPPPPPPPRGHAGLREEEPRGRRRRRRRRRRDHIRTKKSFVFWNTLNTPFLCVSFLIKDSLIDVSFFGGFRRTALSWRSARNTRLLSRDVFRFADAEYIYICRACFDLLLLLLIIIIIIKRIITLCRAEID